MNKVILKLYLKSTFAWADILSTLKAVGFQVTKEDKEYRQVTGLVDEIKAANVAKLKCVNSAAKLADVTHIADITNLLKKKP